MNESSPLLRPQDRRRFLIGCSGVVAATVTHTLPAAAAVPRSLNLQNLHTGEVLRTSYWAGGEYLRDAMTQVAWVLRDHRTNTAHAIDPKLLDLLHFLNAKLDTTKPFQVISGYRSPKSNAALHAASEGVATHSLHMTGMAVDIRVPGVALRNVLAAAVDLRQGGVGYYPHSDFVHVDVGRVRYW